MRLSCMSSMDSLLDWTTDPSTPPPTLPARGKTTAPPPLPARKKLGTSPNKKVTIATEEVMVVNISSDQEEVQESEEAQEVSSVNTKALLGLEEKVPTLPSVKELAVKFQPKKSPEPKPRRSLLKKKSSDGRPQKP